MSRHSIFKGSFSTSETELKAVWPAISLEEQQVMKPCHGERRALFSLPLDSWKGEKQRELLSCSTTLWPCAYPRARRVTHL